MFICSCCFEFLLLLLCCCFVFLDFVAKIAHFWCIFLFKNKISNSVPSCKILVFCRYNNCINIIIHSIWRNMETLWKSLGKSQIFTNTRFVTSAPFYKEIHPKGNKLSHCDLSFLQHKNYFQITFKMHFLRGSFLICL